MEDMGLELPETRKVIMPGEPGYKGAWDANRRPEPGEPSQDQLRDAAINSADIAQLEEALDRLESQENPSTTALEALSRVRTRIDELIKRKQN